MINTKEENNQYHLFPLGNAREPISSIKRANAVIANLDSMSSDINNVCINNNINRFHVDKIFALVGENGGVIDDFTNLCGIAVCGIAKPESFLKALNDYKINVSTQFIVKDHYHYTERDINQIYQSMGENNCNTIITTWKDYYKIYPLNIKNQKIIILDVKLEIKDNALLSMIDEVTGEN
jgi:tetraacyldisaccharide 4'-kinase